MKKKTHILLATALSLQAVSSPIAMFAGQAVQAKEKVNVNEKKQVSTTKTTQSAPYRNVMYYGDWSIWGGQGMFYPKDIPAEDLTHLNFAFLDFDGNGDFQFTDKYAAIDAGVGDANTTYGENQGILNSLQALKSRNPNLKLGVSIGGWSKSGEFSEIAASPEKRANFVKNAMKFIKYTNMDFVDIDWEYPAMKRDPDKVDNTNDEGTPHATPADKENYIKLLKDLKAGLNKQGQELNKKYELSVALATSQKTLQASVDTQKLFETVDFANVMTYDMHGAWEGQSGHHSALYSNPNNPTGDDKLSIDDTVKYLLDGGAPSEKVVIGAAFYTRGWNKVAKGNDADHPGLFQKAEKNFQDADGSPTYGTINDVDIKLGEGGRASGVWSYRNIDQLKNKIPDLKEYWDDIAKAPYLYSEKTGQFFTYDNVKSVQAKADYVKKHKLGGMISWMQSQDKASTSGSNKRDELTKAIKTEMLGNSALPANEKSYTPLDINATVTVGTSANNGKPAYKVTIKNNEKAEEKGDVLQRVEKSFETIKLPVINLQLNTDEKLTAEQSGKLTQDGKNVTIDLRDVWNMKFIHAGESVTLTLVPQSGTPAADHISNMTISQQMLPGSPIMGSQVIYGSDQPSENKAPVLNGVNNKTIKVGDEFDPRAGVTATDEEDGDLTSAIEVNGSVDTSKAGDYELTYSVTDSQGKTTEKKRTITVEEQPAENKAPVLNGVNDATIKVGDEFDPRAGVTATDEEDGNLTSSIQIDGSVDTAKAGTYTLTYSVTDSDGAKTEKERTITVEEQPAENKAPVLNGVEDTVIRVGDEFDPRTGVTATDEEDGDLTSAIEINGSVDTSKAGDYELTYSVTDSQGKTTEKKRTVTVEEQPAENEAPVLNGVEDATIKVGDKFDPLQGVTATDKEDGDLTSAIKVTGRVNTEQPGTYTLTYSVTDKGGKNAEKDRFITVKSKSEDAASDMVNPTGNVMVGYWHNWPKGSGDGYKYGSSAAMNLDEINSSYNVVDVSFMKGDGSSRIPTFKPYNMSDEAFRQQVAELNAQGRSVLLALGGADAHIELTKADEDAFVQEIIHQVDEYGFDGLDIDLEQSAITAGENETVIPSALQQVKEHYEKEGKNFLITMAPEFPYLKPNGNYEKYINSLKGYYDWVNPQFYNQGGDGVWVDEINQWVSQDKDELKEEFLYYMADSFIHGTRGYLSIPADKLVIGLPSNNDAARTGYVKDPKAVYNAFGRLALAGTPLKGLMTWSVNWDNGKDANGKAYNWEFANNYRSLIYGGGGIEPPTDTEKPTAPQNLTASEVTDKKVSLTWESSSDNVGVKEYKVYRNNRLVRNVSETSFVDTDVQPDTDYSYYVVAVDHSNNESAKSNTVAVHTEQDTTQQPDTEAPTAPKNAHVKEDTLTSTSAVLKWDASTDNKGVVGYRVYQSNKLVADVTTTEVKVENLTPGKIYGYFIMAYDAAGNKSPLSNLVAFMTPKEDVDTEAPTAPTNVHVKENTLTSTGATIKWNASTDNKEVAGYTVYDQNNQPISNVTNTEFKLENLTPGTSYSYKVQAYDAAGNKSPFSETVTFITPNTDNPGGGGDDEYPTWDISKTYHAGDMVNYNGTIYKAQWEQTGQNPSTSNGWVYVSGDIPEWNNIKEYRAKDRVMYKGSMYEAKWSNSNTAPDTSYGPWNKLS